MPANPIQAFVSSTYEDLKRHRANVIKALRRASVFVDPMEDWTAESDPPKTFSQDRLAGCHFCVLLVAFRRGYVPENENSSITQLEYDAAVVRGIDVLVYLLDGHADWPAEFNELDSDPQIRAWRSNLEQMHGRELFRTDPASIDIAPAITRWVIKHTHPVVSDLSGLAGELTGYEDALRDRKDAVVSHLQHACDLIQHAHDELEKGYVPHGTCEQIYHTGELLFKAIGDAVSSDDFTRLKEILEGAYRVEMLHSSWKDEADKQLNLAELARTRGRFAALVAAIQASPVRS